jgi:DNA-directed RNA polymerase
MITGDDIMGVQYESLQAMQVALEEEAVGASAGRYAKLRARGETETAAGRTLLQRVMGTVMGAIDDFVKELDEGVPSRSAGVYYMLAQADTTTVAYLTCQSLIDACGSGEHRLTTTALNLASRVEDSINYEILKETEPRLYRKLHEKISKSRDPHYKHVLLTRQLNYGQIKRIQWGISERTRLGITLVTMAQEAGLVDLQQSPVKDSPLYVVLTEEVSEWLKKAHAAAELTMPAYMPMVVPPKRWAPGKSGGYSHKNLWLPLVKGAKRGYLSELSEADMPDVYAALNAVQETAWAVEPVVLRAAEALWEEGTSVSKLPSRDDEPLPPKPHDIDTNEEALRTWKAEAAQVHYQNIITRGKRLSALQTVRLARKFSDLVIYFPHNLDFRGRMYAVPLHLHPQGDDLCRGLLTFSKGVPLGPDGQYWLAVHGANSFGVDKVAFDERVEWVEQHHDEVIACAVDPMKNRWWTEADGGRGAFRFLAFCAEWLRLRYHTLMGLPAETFPSTLPVGWDGSCNGLQHFSAMLRDPVGGRATNLIPSDKPSDIYTEVKKAAEEITKADAVKGDPTAPAWLGKVTRTLAKRPTMTYAYGSGRFGYRKQTVIELKTMDDAAKKLMGPSFEPHIVGWDHFQAANYFAGVMVKAIPKVVSAAAQAMSWLQVVARAACADGLAVTWTAPTGFLARQEYTEVHGKVLDVTILGERRQVRIQVDTTTVDRRAQAQGIAPNFVHSLDAAHLATTVSRCKEAGIDAFAMIHDSYGTHAGNAGQLRDILRECFVDQYRGNVLDCFRGEMVGLMHDPAAAEKVPPTPEMGSLDLEQVTRSEYFFA